jgi:hypothetical protein
MAKNGQLINLEPRNLELRTSNFEPQTSNLELRTSNFEPQTSNLEPQVSNVSAPELMDYLAIGFVSITKGFFPNSQPTDTPAMRWNILGPPS